MRLPVATTVETDVVMEDDEITPGNEHILFVDDEPALVRMGSWMLEGLGYTVTSENNSSEAFEQFKENPETYDLLITDMTMLQMTGDLLAIEVRKIRPYIPIVLYIGYSNRIIETEVKNLGINAFACKPFSKSQFAQIVRKFLEESSEYESLG